MSIPKAELGARVRLEGAEALDEGGALVLAAHHGNMLWAVGALADAVPAPGLRGLQATARRRSCTVCWRPSGRASTGPWCRSGRCAGPCFAVGRKTVCSFWSPTSSRAPPNAARSSSAAGGRPSSPGRTASAAHLIGRSITCPAGGRGGAAISAGSRNSANRLMRKMAPVSCSAMRRGWRPTSRSAPEDWLWFHKRWKD